jgi:hypothetical protein
MPDHLASRTLRTKLALIAATAAFFYYAEDLLVAIETAPWPSWQPLIDKIKQPFMFRD